MEEKGIRAFAGAVGGSPLERGFVGAEKTRGAAREESSATNDSTAAGLCSAFEVSLETPSQAAAAVALGGASARQLPLLNRDGNRRWLCGRRRLGRLFVVYAKAGRASGDGQVLWVVGPQWRFSLAMLGAMLALETLFFSTLRPVLQEHLFVCVSQMVLAALTLGFFAVTVFKDPGLPRELRRNFFFNPRGVVCLSRSSASEDGAADVSDFWAETPDATFFSLQLPEEPPCASPRRKRAPGEDADADLEAQSKTLASSSGEERAEATPRDRKEDDEEAGIQEDAGRQLRRDSQLASSPQEDLEGHDVSRALDGTLWKTHNQDAKALPPAAAFSSSPCREAASGGGAARCINSLVVESEDFSKGRLARSARGGSRLGDALRLKRQLVRRLQERRMQQERRRNDGRGGRSEASSSSDSQSSSSSGGGFCFECGIRCMVEDVQHCEDCGVCIEGLDHHCPWTSKCVGRKNLLPFYGWVCSGLAAVLLYGVAASSLSLRETPL